MRSAINRCAFNFYKNSHFGRVLLVILLFNCLMAASQTYPIILPYSKVTHGSARIDVLLPLLKGKKVAIVTNPSGLVGKRTLVDTLLSLKVDVVKIFGPEHGFRGDVDASELVKNGIDPVTNLPVISLYGANKKPKPEQLEGVEVVVFDIQDVGVRFYTYIATMTYVMDACADAGIPVIVCDRPNPNGFYVDGPIMEKNCVSFLGLHPVPIVYGLTIGEYAKMVVGEKWLNSPKPCALTVVPLLNYNRKASYQLPVAPSPNLRDAEAVLLYPSLGLFEGTIMSLGRGTNSPFKVVGHPNYLDTTFCFIPSPSPLNNNPRYNNKRCYGMNLSGNAYVNHHPNKLQLQWLIIAYKNSSVRPFFEGTFNQHAGNTRLKDEITNGVSEKIIRKNWEKDLQKFLSIRKKYLLYPDFR